VREVGFFKLDLVSDAKCHERVFEIGVPGTIIIHIQLKEKRREVENRHQSQKFQKGHFSPIIDLKKEDEFWFEIYFVLH